MSFPLIDGLGGAEVMAGSRTGLPNQSQFLTGSLIVANGLVITGSEVQSSSTVYTGGSPYNLGWVTQQFTARSIVSGGAWVGGSGGLVYQLGASPKAPLGVAAATAQSGATANIIVRGIVPMIADGTVAAVGGAMPGAGAAGNTVSPHVAGSSLQYPTLDAAASGGTVFVIL